MGTLKDAPRWLDWSVAERPAEGQYESGDAWVVEIGPTDALVAAVDVLGHGTHAALVARELVDELKRSTALSATEILEACHLRIRGSRGAALTVARIDARTAKLTWCGVGNVDGIVLRAPGSAPNREGILALAGIVGANLPKLRSSTLVLRQGDLLVLASDGVHPAFSSSVAAAEPVRRVAAAILEAHGRRDDDAVVVAARWLGGAP